MTAMVAAIHVGIPLGGQGWRQIGELALALMLSAGIGLEREFRQRMRG